MLRLPNLMSSYLSSFVLCLIRSYPSHHRCPFTGSSSYPSYSSYSSYPSNPGYSSYPSISG